MMNMLALDENWSWQPFDSSTLSSFVTSLFPSRQEETLTFAIAQRSPRYDELQEALGKLKSLRSLGPNWNSYQSEQISSQAIQGSWSLLKTIYQRGDVPMPSIVPTANGGVQIEWHKNLYDLEIEFESLTRADVYFEQDGEEPVEFPLQNDFTILNPYLDLISAL